jgi:caffeoyl-CoA O-methyltransferase
VALALPNDGKIVACDVSEEWTAIARRYWTLAGVDHKIDLRLRRATRTLDELIERGESGSYDYAFIDADKTSYDAYYERVLTLLRPGGLVLLDNVLWSGRVADPAVTDADTVALRELNAKVHRDERVDASLVGIGDGLLLARKR